jgi:hypothetical protein
MEFLHLISVLSPVGEKIEEQGYCCHRFSSHVLEHVYDTSARNGGDSMAMNLHGLASFPGSASAGLESSATSKVF